MRRAVVVVKQVDPVAPVAAPAVGMQQILDLCRVRLGQRLPVDQQRQVWVIGISPIVLQAIGESVRFLGDHMIGSTGWTVGVA